MHKKMRFTVTPRAEALARRLQCTPAALLVHAGESIKSRPISFGNTLIWMAFGLPERAMEFVLLPGRGEMIIDEADWTALSAMDESGMSRRFRR